MQANRNKEMDTAIATGDYRSAAVLAEQRMGLKPTQDGSLPEVTFKSGNILDHLDAAQGWLAAGDPDRSIAHFDAAESALKSVETESLAASGAKQIGASLVNDTLLDYVPSPAEAVLINYYKAIDFWKKGDLDNTRVELNRAGDRTRRAVDRYADEIRRAEAKASDKSGAQSYRNSKVQEGVTRNFPDMAQWTPYKDFIIPPATYLQALFLGRSKDADDHHTAADLYGRLVALAEGNEAVAADAAEAAQGQVCPTNNCTWILVEHGLGPDLVERRFDLPIVTSSGLIAVSMALPSLHSRTASDELPLRVSIDQSTVDIPLMGSMDRVVQSEFQKRFPGIVTRALISSTAKAVAQNEINKQAGPVAGLVAAIASAASTSADIRSWRSTPGRWSLVRVSGNGSHTLSFDSLAAHSESKIEGEGCHLVYVRAINNTIAPVVTVLPL